MVDSSLVPLSLSFRFVFILICKMDETILKESVSSLVFVDEWMKWVAVNSICFIGPSKKSRELCVVKGRDLVHWGRAVGYIPTTKASYTDWNHKWNNMKKGLIIEVDGVLRSQAIAQSLSSFRVSLHGWISQILLNLSTCASFLRYVRSTVGRQDIWILPLHRSSSENLNNHS